MKVNIFEIEKIAGTLIHWGYQFEGNVSLNVFTSGY